MLYNYLKIAFRNLWKNRVFTFVNAGGLALGIAAFVLILEYVAFERSVNQFHTNLPTLYRLTGQNPEGETWTDMAPAVAPLARQTFPEVRAFCRIAESAAKGIVSLEGERGQPLRSFRETDIVYADASFFTLFSFPLRQGEASAALVQPNTVALSESQARKYFGNDRALGRTLVLNNQFGKTTYTVTAVYADMPAASDYQFQMVLSLQTLANPANLNGNGWARLDGFDGAYLTTFLQLTETADSDVLAGKFNELKKQRNASDDSVFGLQPAAHIHLAASLGETYPTTGSLAFVYLLTGIAVLILVIAWFNYINLSTATALKRAREVGVRKAIGAERSQLVVQFMGESLLLNGVGLLLGLALVISLQNVYNLLIEKDLSLATLRHDSLWLAGLALVLGGAVGSGIYTALALSSFNPVQTLKGLYGGVGRGALLRKSLVVFQFGISVALIIGTLVLYRQLQFMQTQELGFDPKNRVVIRSPQVGSSEILNTRWAALGQQLEQRPFVRSYARTGITPGAYYNFSTNGITRPNPRPGDEKKVYSMGIVDNRYLQTMGIALAAGRNFTDGECEKEWETSAKVVINEAAARQLGFASAEAATGQFINWGQAYEIVGVIKNYHHQGLRQPIEPMILLPRTYAGDLIVELTTDRKENLAQLEQLYRAAFPGNPFEAFFLEENYIRQYRSEQQYSIVFTAASALAIFIACLGLFGLATFMAEQRTKEIGIRKVLGASGTSIVTLLARDFLKLVLIAIIIASPLAWWAAQRWLQDFAFRTDLNGWIFAAAGGLAVLIALLTVSFQAIKAALVNPVKSLRTE
ncbi:ABC transporter permease [Tellurirhabdus rosea]|uniref:ABC transporter permease n=1 Tax=Tellurirhabdus rosea TaxID=2674997 RepID=UPI00225488F0|nr:ABC transporter permease [Tellurirhabdus rosea]